MNFILQEKTFGSLNDIFSWDWYDWLPKSGSTDVLGLTNQFRPKIYSAWHVSATGVAFHTRRYILKRAIMENRLEDVKEVLDKGFDVNQIIDQKYGFTPLSLAAILNRTAMIQYLYFRGAQPDILDSSNNTALMHAVKNWNFDSVKLLVENCHADLDISDRFGFTAADKALNKKLIAIARYLQSASENRQNRVAELELGSIQQKHIESPKSFFWQRKKDIPPNSAPKFSAPTIDFPRFTIEFDFESHFADSAGDSLIKNKKIYQNTALKYPFNNFKGQYRVSFIHKLPLSEAIAKYSPSQQEKQSQIN